MKGPFEFSFMDLAMALALVGFVVWMVRVGPAGTIF
jgi:flagellar biogenesis protein FliO